MVCGHDVLDDAHCEVGDGPPGGVRLPIGRGKLDCGSAPKQVGDEGRRTNQGDTLNDSAQEGCLLHSEPRCYRLKEQCAHELARPDGWKVSGAQDAESHGLPEFMIDLRVVPSVCFPLTSSPNSFSHDGSVWIAPNELTSLTISARNCSQGEGHSQTVQDVTEREHCTAEEHVRGDPSPFAHIVKRS